MDENPKRYRFGSEFNNIVKSSAQEKKWYQFTLRDKMTWRNGYMLSANGSFLLMLLFGILAIRVDTMCMIQNPEGRCCNCVHIEDADTRLHGQTIPRQDNLNSVFYGVIMIVNSLFGISYVYTGLRDENKYLLFCMMVTQALEVCRGLFDVILEPVGQEAHSMRLTREVIMFSALFLMIVSWVCMRPVYKLFGWKIFRRGGAKKSIRQMYKNFQRFRALNLLDIQSSAMLFLIFILYFDIVRWSYGWVFIVVLLCDIQASRYMVKYLKRESKGGVLVSAISKAFVVAWWCAVLAVYATCYQRYEESRKRTVDWFKLPRVPYLPSIYNTYNGLSCLTPKTSHDARTLEVAALNFAQAIVFRFGSMIITTVVVKNFGKGLRDVFYKRREESHGSSLMEDGDDTEMIGGPATADDPAVGEFSDEDVNDEDLEWGQ